MKFKNNVFYVILSFLLIIMGLVFVLQSSGMSSSHYNIRSLEEGWTVSVNGEKISSDGLISDVTIPVINKYDTLTLSRMIYQANSNSCCMSFYSKHAVVEASIDDTPIYSFGRNLLDANKAVPNYYNNIPLRSSYEGHVLTITLTGSRNASFSSLNEFITGSRKNVNFYHISSQSINLFSGVFLAMLGLLLIAVSPFLIVYNSFDLKILFSGFISLTFGTYILGLYNYLDMFLGDPNVNYLCEYIALIHIPIAISGYLFSIYKDNTKKAFLCQCCLDEAVFLIMLALNTVNIIRFSEMTSFIHGSIIIESLLTFVIIFFDHMKRKKETSKLYISSDSIFTFGVIIFMVLSLGDIVIYNIKKYSGNSGISKSSVSGFTLGALLFVVCLLISYLFYNISSMNYETLTDSIEGLAYSDALTGLANRARCEQIMDFISSEHDLFAIISIDLNKLKQVNDKLGHAEGDRLLSGFATILSTCFWDAVLIGRMGGDEFIIILSNDQANNCTRRIHELYSLIDEWNSKEQHFRYSASYGYAYSYEVPSGSANEVYMLADSRMYEMKKEHQVSEDKEVVIRA